MKKVVTFGGILLILLRLFLFSVVFTSGSSMYPTINDGDCLLLRRYGSVNKGDIVSIYSQKLGKTLCKRVVALEGDTVEWSNNTLSVNGKEVQPICKGEGKSIKVGLGEVFVLGDNREHSTDSRQLGMLQKSDIKGVLIFNLGGVGFTKIAYAFIVLVCIAIYICVTSKNFRRVKKRYPLDKSKK